MGSSFYPAFLNNAFVPAFKVSLFLKILISLREIDMDPALRQSSARIGVLSLQGNFEAHIQCLTSLGLKSFEVRKSSELEGLNGLILPGGESTTILKFLQEEGLFEAIQKFYHTGGGVFGTCAGLILMARKVKNPSQGSLELLDVEVTRNAYGRQRESFQADIEIEGFDKLEGVFIRAPQITACGEEIQVLASYQGAPVLVQQGKRLLAATFHPELTHSQALHRYFLQMLTA